MHEDCHPAIFTYGTYKKLVCFGGEVKPYKHDKLWVKLPLSFEEPRDLSALHDEFVSRWPEGGHHKHVPPAVAEERGPQATISVKLDGPILEKLTLYANRAGYNRASVIRGLLDLILAEPDDRMAWERFDAWRKEVQKQLGEGG